MRLVRENDDAWICFTPCAAEGTRVDAAETAIVIMNQRPPSRRSR